MLMLHVYLFLCSQNLDPLIQKKVSEWIAGLGLGLPEEQTKHVLDSVDEEQITGESLAKHTVGSLKYALQITSLPAIQILKAYEVIITNASKKAEANSEQTDRKATPNISGKISSILLSGALLEGLSGPNETLKRKTKNSTNIPSAESNKLTSNLGMRRATMGKCVLLGAQKLSTITAKRQRNEVAKIVVAKAERERLRQRRTSNADESKPREKKKG